MIKFRTFATTLCAVAALASCGQKKAATEATEERTEIVETSVITKQSISRVLEVSTTLEGYQTMNVSPSLTGKIEHIFVEVGSYVAAGDMLVRMDQQQYNSTKLTYTNLGIEMQRLEALKETGAVSQQTYDQTKLSYDQTKESLSFLERNTFVKAKFGGVIAAKNYEDGELYSGQPILVLTQIGTLKALVPVPESYYPQVKRGMKVNIKSDIYPDTVFPATIETVYPTVDATSHTFQIKVRIPNGGGKLRPGMYAHSTLELGQAETIMVPYQAVQKMTGTNERFIFINENGIAKRIFVQMGQRIDEKVEIISNEIAEGQEIVTVGQAKLVDGSKINVVKEN